MKKFKEYVAEAAKNIEKITPEEIKSIFTTLNNHDHTKNMYDHPVDKGTHWKYDFDGHGEGFLAKVGGKYIHANGDQMHSGTKWKGASVHDTHKDLAGHIIDSMDPDDANREKAINSVKRYEKKTL